MKKKTFNRKRQLRKKGGATDIGATVIFGDKPGPFIPDNIKRAVDIGEDKSLIKKYEDRKKNAEDDYKTTNENYQRERDRLNNETYSTATWFIAKLPVFYQIYKIIEQIITGLYIIAHAVGSFIIGIILQSGALMSRITDIFTKDRGAVIKAIIFILFIVALVFLILGVTTSVKAPRKSALDIMKTIPLFNDPDNQSAVMKGINSFNDIINTNFGNSFTTSYNSLLKFFGNDVIGGDIRNFKRDTISEGRNDGLIHLKKKDDNFVYTIVEPKDKEININMDDYPEADYHKLPDSIKQLYNPALRVNFNNKIYFKKSNKPGTNEYKYNIKYYTSNDFPEYILKYYDATFIKTEYIPHYETIYKKCVELKKSDPEKFKSIIINFLNHFEVSLRRDSDHNHILYKYKDEIINSHFSFYKSNETFKSALSYFIIMYCALYPIQFQLRVDGRDTSFTNTYYDSSAADRNKAHEKYYDLKKENMTNENFQNFIRALVNYYEVFDYNQEKSTIFAATDFLNIVKILFTNYDKDTTENQNKYKEDTYIFLKQYKGPLIIPRNNTYKDNFSEAFTYYETPKGTFFQANDIDIKKYSFSDADNINEKTLENKLFKFNGNSNKYEYPYDEYIKNKVSLST